MYQGGSDDFLGPTDDAVFGSEDWGIDFEAEVAVIVDDVPMGASAGEAADRIRLLMLVNDWSLRNLVPAELAKGFGFFQSKPATAFSPVAVTPDELGEAWRDSKVHLPIQCHWNGKRVGKARGRRRHGVRLRQAHRARARTRRARAGSIIGSGTVSNSDASRGYSCIAEVRALEMIANGKPGTSFMKFGDRIRIEMLDKPGRSIFGSIDQEVVSTQT